MPTVRSSLKTWRDRAPPVSRRLDRKSRRWLALSAHVVRLIRQLESSEEGVGARDLYWNLTDFSDQYGRVTEEEIQTALDALSSSAIGVLRKNHDVYSSLGSLTTVARRLTLLARMVEESGGDDSSR
jgi:hypothetical protein